MIDYLKGWAGSEWYYCNTCNTGSFDVRISDEGTITIYCTKCLDHLNIGITKETHDILMEEAKK